MPKKPLVIGGYSVPLQLITKFQSIEPVNSTLSRARLAIFSPGENRNGSYISDKVAAQLIQSIAYQPIKGIFDVEEGDFQGHGEDSEGRGYGVVPLECNPAIEKICNPDSQIEEDYVCVDVYLWTHLYEEAKQIVGKKQSLELNRDTVQGQWKINPEGRRLFYYSFAEFQALQVLGDNYTPCFAGSHFFEQEEEQKDYENLVLEVSNFTLQNKEGADATELANRVLLLEELINKFSLEEGARKEEKDMEDNKNIIDPAPIVDEPSQEDKFTEKLLELSEKLTESQKANGELQDKFDALEKEAEELRKFQEKAIAEERTALATKYEAILGKEKVDELVTKYEALDNISLEKELAYETVTAQLLAQESKEPGAPVVYNLTGAGKQDEVGTEIDDIITEYTQKGGNR